MVWACSARPGHLPGAHVGSCGNYQEVVGEVPALGRDPLRVRIHLPNPVLDKRDLLTAGGAFEPDLQLLGVEAEGDVDGVGLEQEVIPVGDESDVGPLFEPHAQIEGRLKPPEPAAQDEYVGSTAVHHGWISFSWLRVSSLIRSLISESVQPERYPALTQVDGSSDQFCLDATKPAGQGLKPRLYPRPHRTTIPQRPARGRLRGRLPAGKIAQRRERRRQSLYL